MLNSFFRSQAPGYGIFPCAVANPAPPSSLTWSARRGVSLILQPNLIWFFALFAGACLSQAPARDIAVREQLTHAVEAAEHGQFDRAKAIDDRVLRAYPGLLPAVKLRGSLLEQSGHADEAAQVYAAALRSAPNDSGLLMKLGVYSLSRHDFAHAIEYLLRYSRLRPADSDGLFYLTQAYHLHAQTDLAIKTIRRCIRLAPSNAQFLQKYGELLTDTGNASEALSWLLKAQRIDSSLERLDFDLALASYYQLDFSHAARYATKALNAHPEDVGALNLLASSHEKLLDWGAASGTYEKILVRMPESPAARLGLGHCQLELGNLQAAIDSIQQALHADPAIPQAHFYLARAFGAIGRSADARHEAALHQKMQQMSFTPPALDSETGRASWLAATRLIEAGQEDDAISQLAQGSSFARRSGDALVLAGSLCLSLGRIEQGERLLRTAIATHPAVRGAHTYMGLAALQRNEIRTAGREFQAELAADPNYLPASEGLGQVRYLQQNWEEAVNLLAASRTTSPTTLYMLTESYFHLGRAQDARLTAEVGAASVLNHPEIAQSFAALLHQYGEAALAERLFPATPVKAP